MKHQRDFLFEVGESVRYVKGASVKSATCTIIDRKRIKDHLLSEMNGRSIYINQYTTEMKVYGLRGKYSHSRFYCDNEVNLVSANIKRPARAVDYESDEISASFIDIEGEVIGIVKSGSIGFAHHTVSKYFQ